MLQESEVRRLRDRYEEELKRFCAIVASGKNADTYCSQLDTYWMKCERICALDLVLEEDSTKRPIIFERVPFPSITTFFSGGDL